MGNQLRDALKALGLAGGRTERPVKVTVEPERRATNPPLPPKSAQRLLAKDVPLPWGTMAQDKSPVQNQPERVGTRTQSSSPRVIPPNRDLVRPAKQDAAATKPVSAASKPDFRLEKTGEFHPHPLFSKDIFEETDSCAQTHSGVERQLSSAPQDETDLIIGLDFGTSATKIVIRDTYAGKVFSVEVNQGTHGVERFLQASCVFIDDGVFTLSGAGVRLDDLKLSLLDCKAVLPVTEFNHCCAFLALMIRRARGWLLTEHEAIYRNHELNWFINVGLAARSYQDEEKVNLFRRLAWAAANLAADVRYPQIDLDSVDQYRKLSQQAFSAQVPEEVAGMEFAPADVGVIPEVSAQIQGFMTSARWDWENRPIMMLVDVGAGTVDTALFHVKPSKGTDGVLTFYSSRVQSNGAMNLHRERVSWLEKNVPATLEFLQVHSYLKSIAQPTGRIKPIPNHAADYLPGYRITDVTSDVDEMFRLKRYRAQVAGSINEAKVKKGLGARGSQQLRGVPLLLCGGGSRLPIYSAIAEEINITPNWDVSVEKTLMPVPTELKDAGWQLEDFDRISVAYGLSLQQSLEKIVREIQVPDASRYVSTANDDRYVSKDQC